MSDINRRFSIALDAYLELKADEETLLSSPVPVSPSANSSLAEIGPLHRTALLLGVAFDRLPVLLNLHDPVPGPLLVVGEAGVGKTNFLQSIVRGLMQTHDPRDLQYAVATDRPDEWENVDLSPHLAGVFSTDNTSTQELILSLAAWAHLNKGTYQSILLLVDGLEAIAKLDFDSLQNFRWLLARGPSRRVWPVVTLNSDRYGQVISWIPNFRTRIFGRIRNERIADALGGNKSSTLDTLEAPSQFALRENGDWVRFWLPNF